MSDQQWSPLVQNLLAELRNGGDIALVTPDYTSRAFDDLSIAYLSNAVALCHDCSMSDFRLPMAFYGIRHALELFLKCTLRNELIDRGLSRLSKGKGFEEIAKASGQDNKHGRFHLKRALCGFRNLYQDGLRAPEMWDQNMDDTWVDKSIECVREHGGQLRSRFADLWQLPIGGHDLRTLWREVRYNIEFAKMGADVHAQQAAGLVRTVDMVTLDAAIEMLGTLDPIGDAFRYPLSMTGEWHNKLPPISLERLGELAGLLEQTVRTFDSYFTEAYTLSTIGHPLPGNLLGI